MDYKDLIAEYLSAYADNQLGSSQRRRVEDHLDGCASCRARLADERSLKALIRRHAGIVKAPADVRLRIRAALGEIVEPNFAGARSIDRYARSQSFIAACGRVTRLTLEQVPHVRVWAPLAAVAALFVLLNGRSGPTRAAEPAFDLAITEFDSLARNFMPNVPVDAYSNESSQNGASFAWVVSTDPNHRVSDTIEDVADSYMQADMPDDLYNFDLSGYLLDGGRLDHMPDGRPVTYTLYRGNRGPGDVILNICLKDPRMMLPVGAVYWFETHSFYQYKGYSFCVTFYPTGHFVSIVVAHMPLTQLIRSVALAEAVNNGDTQ